MVLFGSALLLGFVFFGTWKLSVRKDNYSFVDVAWALSFAPVALGYALLLDGWWVRKVIVAFLVCGWSLRLGVYLWGRVAAHHPAEDPRYAVLRERWSDVLKSRFLKFFLAQSVLVWLLMLPVYLIARQTEVGFQPIEIAGIVLWFVALLGEGLADRQLKRFKQANSDAKAVCQEGLWRYSRHPNYFFQSLLWWALFLMATPAPWGWTAILAPFAMLWFLLRVTGIPLTERLAVERKGKAYETYQQTTNAFVPWWRKAQTTSS